MNLASVVILVALLAVVALVVVHLWRNRGNACCGCGREECPSRRAGRKAREK